MESIVEGIDEEEPHRLHGYGIPGLLCEVPNVLLVLDNPVFCRGSQAVMLRGMRTLSGSLWRMDTTSFLLSPLRRFDSVLWANRYSAFY
jgi:hypothetical protein